MNTVRLAAAGAGKTYGICCEALEEIRENECARVLMVTYTNRGAEAIRAELEAQNYGVLPVGIAIYTWYQFLLKELIKPYQTYITGINKLVSLDFSLEHSRNYALAGTAKRYITDSDNVRSEEASNLILLLDERSEHKVFSRLAKTYSSIYIDEVQDLAGRDIEILEKLFALDSINDEMITRHLCDSILQDHNGCLLSVGIQNFPNEAGYFMLWELSVSDDMRDKRIIPIFVNESYVLRPMAGSRIMNVFLDETSKLNCHMVSNLPEEDYQRMQEICMDFAYNTFVELKDKHAKRSSEQYEKYKYALSLRKEAAEHIGIENIRRSRIAKLVREENDIEAEYKRSGTVLPDFRLMMLIRLEA